VPTHLGVGTSKDRLWPIDRMMIPCAYVVGVIRMRASGVKAQSAFYGRYFKMAYLGVCLVTFVLSRLHP
jgi:hypothetical protein